MFSAIHGLDGVQVAPIRRFPPSQNSGSLSRSFNATSKANTPTQFSVVNEQTLMPFGTSIQWAASSPRDASNSLSLLATGQKIHMWGELQALPAGAEPNPRVDIEGIVRNYSIMHDQVAILSLVRESPHLGRLLVEAVSPLRRWFGENVVLRLELLVGGEGATLSAIAAIPAVFFEPESALKGFDTDWWVPNCQRAGAMLNFDYEFRDAL